MTVEEVAQITGGKLHYGRSIRGWYADIRDVEISIDGCMLSGACGFGKTKREARTELAKAVAGQRLIFHAWKSDRKTFNIPLTVK